MSDRFIYLPSPNPAPLFILERNTPSSFDCHQMKYKVIAVFGTLVQLLDEYFILGVMIIHKTTSWEKLSSVSSPVLSWELCVSSVAGSVLSLIAGVYTSIWNRFKRHVKVLDWIALMENVQALLYKASWYLSVHLHDVSSSKMEVLIRATAARPTSFTYAPICLSVIRMRMDWVKSSRRKSLFQRLG